VAGTLALPTRWLLHLIREDTMRVSPPPYALLRVHFPDPFNVPPEELWRWIGHSDKILDSQWRNTCAVRMSLALLGAGIHLPAGFLKIEAGKYRGEYIEIKQEVLAAYLSKIWGEPEKFGAALLRERVADRRGVIRFVGLWGPFDSQGHIDLVCHDEHHRLACEGGHVYLHAVECWFWECP
jgi:hypothetical protein